MKILLMVALMAEEQEAGILAGQRMTALLSYEDLNHLAGLSTVQIRAGKTFLCGHGLVTVAHEGQGRRTRYFLGSGDRFEPQAFIPCRHRVQPQERKPVEKLQDLSCTEVHDLNALKIYLVLCTLSGGRDLSVTLRPSVVSQLTNIPETKIAEGLDNLAQRSLVSVQSTTLRQDDGIDSLRVDPLPLH
ncbi:hypothetical protein [Methylobacterium nigriterrae]|uniref:hypothetical protein n=1 Tax=Methylobacterium nigriterrae TaxID=3127512 RepID=UPI00301352CD